jgi:ribose transport system permease protein
MNYNCKASLPKTKFAGKRKFLTLKKNFIMSVGFPLIAVGISLTLSMIGGEGLFEGGTFWDFAKSALLVFIACLALNTNLNSGRMDFSLGATGILAALLAAKIVGDVNTLKDIMLMMVLTITFGMVIGLIGGLVYIALKLPPIVTSLGMCLVYEGIAKIIVGSNNSYVVNGNAIYTYWATVPFNVLLILIVLIVIMSIALCYSKYGYNKLALVYDQKISVDTGINEIRSCIISYILAGALIGLYQFVDSAGKSMIQINTDLASSTTVFKNFLPIFIGGLIAKYNNQIIGLVLAIFSTQMIYQGMDCSGIVSATAQNLITGFSVFAVLVYMVDKYRFINWVKMRKYLWREKKIKPDIPQPKVD